MPWDNAPAGKSKTAEAIAAAIKRRRVEPNTEKPAPTSYKLRRAVVLESQFNLPPGPRASDNWKLSDGINNSGLALWLSCRHQFYLRYVCGYEFPQYSEPLEFGNVFHWLIEGWLRREIVKVHNVERDLRERYHGPWFKALGVPMTPKQKETQETFYAVAAAMFPTYCKKYQDDRTLGGAVERPFEAVVKIKTGIKVPLYGTIDLEQAAGRGRIDIVDHKTSSWINEGEIAAALPLNFQLMFYAFARNLEDGSVTSSICHDVIRRSSAKKTQKESVHSFAARIGKEAAAKPEHFFQRFRVDVGAKKLELFAEWIIKPILRDFAEWAQGRGPHYPNVNALVGRYGPCKLFGPITAGNFAGVPRRRPTTRGVER